MSTASFSEKRTIAIAIDPSEYAEYAFDWYCKYLHHETNNVVAIHVALDFDVTKAQKEIAKGGQLKQNLERQYSKITELETKFSKKMKAASIKGSVLSVPSKNAGQSILDTAKEEGAFAILMGTRNRSKIKKAFLGSVSEIYLGSGLCIINPGENYDVLHRFAGILRRWYLKLVFHVCGNWLHNMEMNG